VKRKREGMDDLLPLLTGSRRDDDTWEPGFEAGRCLVRARLGPFERVYLRPSRFRKRFYHRLYPMPVDSWKIETAFPLFAGLCVVEVGLRIRFQATLRYAERNPESWDGINRHVRAQLEPLLFDQIDACLAPLESGAWIEEGLGETAKRLATAINETLALNAVQGRALCTLKPVFADPAEEEGAVSVREEIVRAICEKRAKTERLRFQDDQRRREEALRRDLQRIRFALDGSARKQAEEAEGRKRRLEAKRRQMAELRRIERQIHHETLRHRSRLEQMVLEKQRRDAEKRRAMAARQVGAPEAGSRQGGVPLDEDFPPRPDSASRDPGWEAASELREQAQHLRALEERLQRLMAGRESAGQMTVGQGTASTPWLDRLGQWTGRLLFFIRMRR